MTAALGNKFPLISARGLVGCTAARPTRNSNWNTAPCAGRQHCSTAPHRHVVRAAERHGGVEVRLLAAEQRQRAGAVLAPLVGPEGGGGACVIVAGSSWRRAAAEPTPHASSNRGTTRRWMLLRLALRTRQEQLKPRGPTAARAAAASATVDAHSVVTCVGHPVAVHLGQQAGGKAAVGPGERRRA